MTYRWLTDLDVALAAAGVPFVEVDENPNDYTGANDWRTRGRPLSTGEFDPAGVLCHHTASPAGTSDQTDINVILWGNGDAPGPISQLYIGRSTTVYILAAGRANHAGKATIPFYAGGQCTDGNARLIGIEVGNAGDGEPWSDGLCSIYARVVNALITHYGWGIDRVLLHATTGPPCGNHKIDPAGPWTLEPDLQGYGEGTWDLDLWRQFVLDNGGTPPVATSSQYLWRSPRYFNTWLIGYGGVVYITSAVYNALLANGVTEVREDNETAVTSYLTVTGQTRNDLVADPGFTG